MKMKDNKKRGSFSPYIMILPTLLLLALFNFYPIILSLIKSMFRWSGSFGEFGINEFIGLGNYISLLSDSIFWQSWGNAAFFMVTGIAVNLIFPFLCAVMIFSIANGRSSYRWRVFFVAPMVVPSMVIFLLWQFIYDVDIGFVNNILKIFGNSVGVDFLDNPSAVKWAIRFMGFPWMGGTFLLISLAGLSNIVKSLREAARIDGAGKLKTIFSIDIPMCLAQFKMIFTLTIIGEIQDFVKIQTITEGGPGYYSYVPGLYMYKTAFDSSEFGLASAMGIVMLAVMLGFTFLSGKLFKTEAYD